MPNKMTKFMQIKTISTFSAIHGVVTKRNLHQNVDNGAKKGVAAFFKFSV